MFKTFGEVIFNSCDDIFKSLNGKSINNSNFKNSKEDNILMRDSENLVKKLKNMDEERNFKNVDKNVLTLNVAPNRMEKLNVTGQSLEGFAALSLSFKTREMNTVLMLAQLETHSLKRDRIQRNKRVLIKNFDINDDSPPVYNHENIQRQFLALELIDGKVFY